MLRCQFIQSTLETLRARFGRFEDGATIARLSRDEYCYRHADGRVVSVYVFLLLTINNKHAASRSLDLNSMAHWNKESGGESISPEEQHLIVGRFQRYFAAYGEKMETA